MSRGSPNGPKTCAPVKASNVNRGIVNSDAQSAVQVAAMRARSGAHHRPVPQGLHRQTDPAEQQHKHHTGQYTAPIAGGGGRHSADEPGVGGIQRRCTALLIMKGNAALATAK